MLCSSSDVAWLRQRLLIVVMSPEDGTQAAADQPSSRMTSAARRCVAFSISPNRSSNFDMMPSGGPPSMISRRSTGIPTDISCANDSGLDNATYVASQRNSAEKKRGNFQWKISPGVAVTPCSVFSVLAFLIVIGSWRLWTFRSYRALEAASTTSTTKLPRDSCDSTAIHPARKSQQGRSR